MRRPRTDGAAAKDDADFLYKACTNGIPRSCLLYLSRVQVQKISSSTKGDALTEILPIIEAACGQDDPDACNVAAFVEESKSDTAVAGYAEAAQLKACGLGSGASCTRILARGGKRPPPPSELVGPNLERMLGEMRRGCQRGDEEACLALVSAFETKWAVTATPDEVKKLLDELCDGGFSAKVCGRLGKPAPKKKTP